MTTEEIQQQIHELAEYKYSQGFKDGKDERVNIFELRDAYEQGLNDAWECARKVINMTKKEWIDIFNMERPLYVFSCMEVSAVMQRIKEWEERQAKRSCRNCKYDYEICTPKYLDLRCWQQKQTDDETEEGGKFIKIDIARRSEKLRKLILENSELPIVCIVDPDVCGDDCRWWYANEIYYDIGEILACETECADRIFTDKDDFEETLADWMSCQEQWMHLNEVDFEKELQEKLKEYEPYWKKVICIKATV